MFFPSRKRVPNHPLAAQRLRGDHLPGAQARGREGRGRGGPEATNGAWKTVVVPMITSIGHPHCSIGGGNPFFFMKNLPVSETKKLLAAGLRVQSLSFKQFCDQDRGARKARKVSLAGWRLRF